MRSNQQAIHLKKNFCKKKIINDLFLLTFDSRIFESKVGLQLRFANWEQNIRRSFCLLFPHTHGIRSPGSSAMLKLECFAFLYAHLETMLTETSRVIISLKKRLVTDSKHFIKYCLSTARKKQGH